MKALSQNNSRKLLYRRVFGSEKCPDEELAEVSNRILNKCAGVPLAVITMASLLACKPKNKMDWYDVYHSIGTGLEHNQDVENMRRILSFSYYNMPSHMRTCLLYLGMFPEDYIVQKDRLIWMWIAEGFIQCEEQGKSLFELGESYFNQLINRSMIQPIFDQCGMVCECLVHDMVLDLICSISSEANFVTILNGKSHVSSSSEIRRLSIQNVKEDESMTLAQRTLQHVRSVIVLRSTTSQIPAISSFQVLRVMDLQDCNLSQGYNHNMCLGNLFHLRYLGLRNTRIVQLPQEIGNLQFLEVLDITFNKIACLPSNIVQLKHLMCLNMVYLNIVLSTRMPKGFGSLTSLEELSALVLDESNMDIIEELGQLTELRVLHIRLFCEWNDKLAECLCKLKKIQYLTIRVSVRRKMGGLDAWVAPRCLRHLDTYNGCWFQTLPAWMNPSHLRNLSWLSIFVRKVQQADLDMLGKLPALRCLKLFVDQDHEDLGEFLVGAGYFSCLRKCEFRGFLGPVVFQHGAMPSLTLLDLEMSVRRAREIASSCSGVLDLGLGNLYSLQEVTVYFHSVKKDGSYEEREELKAAMEHGIKTHPNHPSLYVYLN